MLLASIDIKIKK